jgi:hypothetical protein
MVTPGRLVLALVVTAGLAAMAGCNELLDVNERALEIEAGPPGDGGSRTDAGDASVVEAGLVGESD